MRVKVKLLKGGKETAVEVTNDSLSVLELKRILAEVYEIPVREQSVVYRGKALLDTRSLSSYGITDGTKLFLAQKSASRTPQVAMEPETDRTPNQALAANAGRDPEPMDVGSGEQMMLTVRLLKDGKEEMLEVENELVTVLEVKKILERRCNIPTYQQSLVVAGKALADSQRLCDYNITSGTKLFLAQKSTPPPPSSLPPSQSSVWSHKTEFWDKLQSYLLQHFSQADTKMIIHKMEERLQRRVYDINLDTVEALATSILREQQTHTHPPC